MKTASNKARWLLAVLELLMRDSKVLMTIFAAYIDERLCYEFFADGIPHRIFDLFSDAIRDDEDFRIAVKTSGIVERGVRRYIRTALDDFDMWYHFLAGIDTILSDQELTCKLSVRDRNIVRGLFELWQEGKLNDETWDGYLAKLRKAA